MIQTILWDVDGTLLDFLAAEEAAIRKLFVEFDMGECSDEMLTRYSKINRSYWERLERNEITKQQVLVGRFKEFFTSEGLDAGVAEEFNAKYQYALGDTIVPRDNSLEIVRKLRGKVNWVWRSRTLNFLRKLFLRSDRRIHVRLSSSVIL